jgi:uracil-DNA glycosylase
VSPLQLLHDEIANCTLCPRLIDHCRSVAVTKRRAYREEEYWGKPVPSFGDPNARLLILGLAPGAHGANRTGRMFTATARATGYTVCSTPPASPPSPPAAQPTTACNCTTPTSPHRAIAPHPDNKPATEEVTQCRAVPATRASASHPSTSRRSARQARPRQLPHGLEATEVRIPFGHNATHQLRPILIDSYHPSQQNTSTGKLTERMLLEVFQNANEILHRTRRP